MIALEGDFALSINRIPGTSLTQALEMQKSLERALLKIPEVKEVFTRMGTAEVATDAQPPSIGDGYVMLKPRMTKPDQPGKRKAANCCDMQYSWSRYRVICCGGAK